MAKQVVRKIRPDEPIFEEPPPAPKGNPPGRKNPHKERILATKAYPGKWIRMTIEPLQNRSGAETVRRGLISYGGRYSWLDEDDDFDAEVRRFGEMGEDTYHVYVKYNGKS
jgi:hypothetical protein